MPVAAIGIGLGTAIAGGAAAGATIYGSRQASRSDREAARIEQEAARRAEQEAREERDYQRAQYDAYLTRLNPYRQMGTDAISRLNGVAASYGTQGAPAASGAGMAGGATRTVQPRVGGDMAPSSSTRPTGEQTAMVMLEAPTGQRRAVPAHQAAHYIARGARRIG